MLYFVFGYEGENDDVDPVVEEKKFSQKEVNEFNKKERLRREAAEQELQRQKDLIEKLQNQHHMTEAEKAELAQKIDEYEKAKMTEKERLDHELAKLRKQAEEERNTLSKQLNEMKSSRDSLIITRAIKEAAMDGKVVAADGTGHQVWAVLRHSAEVNDEGEVVIKGFEYTEDGKSFTADLPVGEAIEKMKASDKWVNFWKDPKIKGFPDPFNSGGAPGNKDPKDFKTYQKLRREGKLPHQRG
jgi:hypothetical protein